MKKFLRKIIFHILKFEAFLVVWKYQPKIIAVTGSVGKTSTKDAIYTALSGFAYVRKSEKSYNSQIGLPLTVLGLPNGWNNLYFWIQNALKGLWLFLYPHNYPKWLVLEVGVGKPGDMADTASWLQTDAVVITAIGETPAHIEFFKNREHLIEEKAGLIKTLKKDGILVLNADDEAVLGMKNKTKNIFVTYGFNLDADIVVSALNISYNENNQPNGIIFRIDVRGKSLPVSISGVFGKNHVYASLATFALAFGLKWNLLEAVNSFKNFEAPPGRMRLLYGINDTLLIDDTYNASPFACEMGLKTLGEVKVLGRKIAVLGDMLELGKHTKEAHENIGKIVQENADILIVVGLRASFIKDGAIENGMIPENIFNFLNSFEAGEFLKNFAQKDDLIFLKGSQGMRMERAVEMILEDQKNKKDLLVRQDPEWLAKK